MAPSNIDIKHVVFPKNMIASYLSSVLVSKIQISAYTLMKVYLELLARPGLGVLHQTN